MYALPAQNLPKGSEWLYEVKFDGYRCLAGRDSTGVTLWSRRENLFTKQFPQIARACERLPPNTLVDGEIVALDESGRVSFNLLQHHRSRAQALVFYAFDVLIYPGRTVIKVPLYFRRPGRGIRPGRNEIESVNRPIAAGGVLVKPGDVIVADGDGVIVVPREKAAAVATYARKILEGDKAARRGLYQKLGLPADSSVK